MPATFYQEGPSRSYDPYARPRRRFDSSEEAERFIERLEAHHRAELSQLQMELSRHNYIKVVADHVVTKQAAGTPATTRSKLLLLK